MGRILIAPFSAAAILQTGYPGFPRTNPLLPMIRKFTLKSRNLARSMGAAGKGTISNGNLVCLLTAGVLFQRWSAQITEAENSEGRSFRAWSYNPCGGRLQPDYTQLRWTLAKLRPSDTRAHLPLLSGCLTRPASVFLTFRPLGKPLAL